MAVFHLLGGDQGLSMWWGLADIFLPRAYEEITSPSTTIIMCGEIVPAPSTNKIKCRRSLQEPAPWAEGWAQGEGASAELPGSAQNGYLIIRDSLRVDLVINYQAHLPREASLWRVRPGFQTLNLEGFLIIHLNLQEEPFKPVVLLHLDCITCAS